MEKMKNGNRLEEEDEEEEVEEAAKELEAWEKTYADERSWESLQEDESGYLHLDKKQQQLEQQRQHRRRMQEAVASHVQKGLIRYLYVILDFSRAAAEKDYKPNRMMVAVNSVKAFVREFSDQNPLSHMGVILIKNGVAKHVSSLSGSPESHVKALDNHLECVGDASLQNALDCAHRFLSHIPPYGHKEVLVLYSALSTCDPGDIMETIKKCKESKIRCSVVGLAAELYICKHFCEETGGTYTVAMDETHFKNLVLEHAPPPAAIAEFATPSLVKMGFPQRAAEGVYSLCACHRDVKAGRGYTCPRCKARICDIPMECPICGFTLVSSAHLARSYHHLFPVVEFQEVLSGTSSNEQMPRNCFGCQQVLPIPGAKDGVRLACPKCKRHFCFECDSYIHGSLHNCPGCESSSTIIS